MRVFMAQLRPKGVVIWLPNATHTSFCLRFIKKGRLLFSTTAWAVFPSLSLAFPFLAAATALFPLFDLQKHLMTLSPRFRALKTRQMKSALAMHMAYLPSYRVLIPERTDSFFKTQLRNYPMKTKTNTKK